MRSFLFTLALLLVPPVAGAEGPWILEGRFQLSYTQPRCVRAPCPPRWTIAREGLRLTVARMEIDAATPAPIQAAIAQASGLSPSTVEGRIRMEGGVATILVREFTPIRRR